jgi:serine/threonine-protein kinase
MKINPGLTIDGRYVVEAHIDTGGMGEVYRVRQRGLMRRAAMKVLRHTGSHARRRFIDEARVAAEIVHDNVIEIYDLGIFASGRPYYVMELLEGEQLSRRLARAPLPIGEVFEVTEQLGAALEAVHEKGYVHRDVKPSNVISTDGSNRRVKLIDFGLAKSEVVSPRLTPLGLAVGSPHWMSPEQCLGETVDERSDIYSFGMLLYVLLSQRHPVEGNTLEVMRARVAADAPRLDLLPSGESCPAGLSLLLKECLARRPSKRPRSMGHVLERIERAAMDHFGTSDTPRQALTVPCPAS